MSWDTKILFDDVDEHTAETCDLDEIEVMIIEERNKDVAQIETDVANLSETQMIISNIIGNQGKELDEAADRLQKVSVFTSSATDLLEESEKHENARRKRTAISVCFAAGATAIMTGITLLYLKTKNKI